MGKWDGEDGMAEMRQWITDYHGKTVDPHSIFSSSSKHLRGFLLFSHCVDYLNANYQLREVIFFYFLRKGIWEIELY